MTKNLNESGRSMVEMLGVLAIIGVLSIGGIMGIRQALTKARANDLIYEANKRATVVSGQLMFSNASPSLSEFVQNEFSFGTFNSVTAGTGTFQINITGVSEAVCAKAQSMSSGMIVGFAPQTCSGDNNTVLLTYNNDLSESTLNTDSTARVPQPEDGPTADDGSTCTGERKGECSVCMQGQYIDSDAVCVDRGGGSCVDGVCQKKEGCLSNGDCRLIDPEHCGNGECFCNYAGRVDNCTGPWAAVGDCVSKTTYAYRTTVTVDSHPYIMTGQLSHPIDWFSAKNFCAAHNARMMTMDELGCGEQGSYCNENNAPNALYTQIRLQLSDKRQATWTADVLSNCNARYIGNSNQQITNSTRSQSNTRVICY